jgi:hypothetical protein
LTRATTEAVIELYSGLRAEGVRVWVDGGWGIDALLGRQTRPHKDFDAIAAFEDLPALTHFLGGLLRTTRPDRARAPGRGGRHSVRA